MIPIRGNNSISPYPSAVTPSTPGIRMPPFNQNGSNFQFPMGRGTGQAHRHQATTGSGQVLYHVGGNQFYFDKPGNYKVTLEYRQTSQFGGVAGAKSARTGPFNEGATGATGILRTPPPSYFSDKQPRPPTPPAV